jgi:hypothetical protein
MQIVYDGEKFRGAARTKGMMVWVWVWVWGHGTQHVDFDLPGLMTQSKNAWTWYIYRGDPKREGGQQWETYKSHSKGGGGKWVGRLTRAFMFLQSSINRLENPHIQSSNIYLKFQSSGTGIGLSGRMSDQGEGGNDLPSILWQFLGVKSVSNQ